MEDKELNELNEIVSGILKDRGSQKMTLEDSDLSCWYNPGIGNPDEIHKFLEEVNNRRSDEMPEAIREFLEAERLNRS